MEPSRHYDITGQSKGMCSQDVSSLFNHYIFRHHTIWLSRIDVKLLDFLGKYLAAVFLSYALTQLEHVIFIILIMEP
jgi:hypothetical protein